MVEARVGSAPIRPATDDTTLEVAKSLAPSPIGVVLRFLVGAGPAAAHRVTGVAVVGSGGRADVQVPDPTVSRRHVRLTIVPAGVAVEDLGSLNGTYYLGQRVEKITLALGATLRVGSVDIVLDPDTDDLVNRALFVGEVYRGVVGRSPSMRNLFAMLERLEGSLATLLLEGESGVGKDVIARAAHDGSAVARKPLVCVNCGALPRELIGSELFGHRKGAFTGATDTRRGAFETADERRPEST